MEQEIWKSIPDFDGYEVSNFGQVRSFRQNRNTPHLRKLSNTRQMYLQVSLRKDGRTYVKIVHRLVMLAFVSRCPYGKEVCHKDGNSQNSRLDNLRYDTHQANMQESKRSNGPNSLTKKLEKKYFGKRKRYRANLIRQDFMLGISKQELVIRYDTSMSNVCHIISRI